MGKFNPLINQYQLNYTTFLLAKCKHTIPDEAGRFDILRECVARKLWEEIAGEKKVYPERIIIKSVEYSSVLPIRATTLTIDRDKNKLLIEIRVNYTPGSQPRSTPGHFVWDSSSSPLLSLSPTLQNTTLSSMVSWPAERKMEKT